VKDRQVERRRRDRASRDEVMALPVIPVREHSVIAVEDDHVQLCWSIGPAGELVVVWVAPGDLGAATARTAEPSGVGFADPRSSRPVPAHVTIQASGITTVTRIPALTLAHITAQPMPGGKILIVGARSAWRADGPDRNAVLCDAQGRVLAEEVLGDGIGHVQATSAGEVWVGYTDEGVYGNYGWGIGGEQPMGWTGIVRFSSRLQPSWRYPVDDRDDLAGPVSHCYALNVTDAAAWTCYYDGFPIVCIRGGVLSVWRNEIKGARALAVTVGHVALYGGYGPHYDRLAVTALEEGQACLIGEYRVVLPDGQTVPPRSLAIGRGSLLHFLIGSRWYQLSIDELLH
jgi:hypothetical protein